MINNVSFQAKYCNTTYVDKVLPNKSLQNMKVKFVELNPDSINDLEALKTINKSWANGNTFAAYIFENFDKDIMGTRYKKFFALTSQKSNMKYLKPEKVLGLLEICEKKKDKLNLNFIQTKPEYEYFNDCREIKNVGKAMLNCLKKTFPDKDIIAEAVDNTFDFYIINGFKNTKCRNFVFKS